MKVALVNPEWRFDGSVYFGCREAHLPLELGYSAALLARAGHDARMFDAALDGCDGAALADAVAAWRPDLTVVTTAPTYLFWRCPPPELASPKRFLTALAGRGGRTVAVGPHGSAAPHAALRKLGVDAVVLGECEEVIAALASARRWGDVPGVALPAAAGDGGAPRLTGPLQAARFVDAPPLAWPDAWIARKTHHHHRFEAPTFAGRAAEVEASRGCPYACVFCAKTHFRDRYRRRDRAALLREIDGLAAQGVAYLYFIDEIFLPDRALLEALRDRNLAFGVQTRIDLWRPEQLDLLAAAGCVSIEAGVDSVTESGRAALAKDSRLSGEAIADRLAHARARVPFVQANLIRAPEDPPEAVAAFRARLAAVGVWSNDPVPLYPYPGAPEYRRLFGAPDDAAWERAHAHYLAAHEAFCDLQAAQPLPLAALEAAAEGR